MAVVLKKLSCVLAAVLMAAAMVVPLPALADDIASKPGGMFCTDGMVTDPDNDDLDAIPASVELDGGCVVPDAPIGI